MRKPVKYNLSEIASQAIAQGAHIHKIQSNESAGISSRQWFDKVTGNETNIVNDRPILHSVDYMGRELFVNAQGEALSFG